MSSDREISRPGKTFYKVPMNIFAVWDVAGVGISQSVKRLATGWTVRGSNPVQNGPGAHPASYTIYLAGIHSQTQHVNH
jgi:hypothetical protein